MVRIVRPDVRGSLAMLRTLELPFPPSLNSIWCTGKNRRTGKPVTYLDRKYVTWRKEADDLYLTQKRAFGGPIIGRFCVEIVVDQRRWNKRKSDVDNRIKPVMDFLQRAGVIENDNLCSEVKAWWGAAPTGCVVRLCAHVEASA